MWPGRVDRPHLAHDPSPDPQDVVGVVPEALRVLHLVDTLRLFPALLVARRHPREVLPAPREHGVLEGHLLPAFPVGPCVRGSGVGGTLEGWTVSGPRVSSTGATAERLH